MIDENLVFYEDWELEACVDGALLAAQMDRVNAVPFTYQQLDVFKRKLDEVGRPARPAALPRAARARPWPSQPPPWVVLPTGLPRVPDPEPELLLPRAQPRGYPQVERDIAGNREISSPSQQRAEEGRSGRQQPPGGSRWGDGVQGPGDAFLPAPRRLRGLLPQVAALIARYVAGGGELDQATLDVLATFSPAYLCFLSPEQLRSVRHSVLW